MKKNIMTVTVNLALSGALLLTGCAGRSSESGNNLVVSTWGLGGDVYQNNTVTPFETANGCKVVLETGTTAERSTKLQSNPNSSVDVIELSQAEAARCFEAGILEPLTVEDFSNAADLLDSAKQVIASGQGVPYTMNVLGIIYDKSAVGFEITDWADLWNPELAGKISIPDISSTFGPAMMYIASDYKGVDIASDNGAAAFEALAELKPNIVKTYSKSSDLANLFSSGEIAAAIIGDFGIETVQRAAQETEFVMPTSGTYANYNTICISANSKNKDLAKAWADWRISKECQTTSAAETFEVPINTTVESTVVEELKGEGFMQALQGSKTVDFSLVNQQLAAWTDSWNKTINN